MKLIFTIALAASVAVAYANETEPDFLVRQAGVSVDTVDIEAIASNIPDDLLAGVMDDPNRIAGYLETIVLHRAVAADARRHGVDQDPVIQREIQILVEGILAKHHVERSIAALPEPDYEQLAKEHYLANRDEFMTQPRVDLSHILISTKSRGDEQALARAREAHQKLIADPAALEALVAQYSDDPSAPNNKGRFSKVVPGRLVPEFEAAAFAMEPGEISEPVKSRHGYHVIVLHEKTPTSQVAFERAKRRIIADLRQRHDEQMRSDFLDKFRAQPMEVNEAAVLALRTRYEDKQRED